MSDPLLPHQLAQLLALDRGEVDALIKLHKKLPWLLPQGEQAEWAVVLRELSLKARPSADFFDTGLQSQLASWKQVAEKHFSTSDPEVLDRELVKMNEVLKEARRKVASPPPSPPAAAPAPPAAALPPDIENPYAAWGELPPRGSENEAYLKVATAIAQQDAKDMEAPPAFRVLTCDRCTGCSFVPSSNGGRAPTLCYTCLTKAGKDNRVRSFAITIRGVAQGLSSKSTG